jgi:hypothetical protein
MTQLTRLQARTLIQELIDDTAAKLWSAANLDLLTEGAIDILWGELLDAFAWLRSTAAGPLTPVTPGTVNLDTALTRFYRLQIVSRQSQTLTETSPRDVLLEGATEIVAPCGTYTIMGNLLYLFPLSTSADVYVRYSSRPTSYTALASDATPVEWPDGYHLAYVYDAASRALEKGDREKSDTFKQRSLDEMARLRAYLRKQSIGPVMPYMDRTAIEWGGV